MGKTKNNMAKSKKKSGEKKVKKKTEIVFDEAKRRDFLTGFRKRKQERRQNAKDEYEKTLKEEIRLAKEKAKKDVNEGNKSSSHQVVPEIEHLLQASYPTDVHDLGTHTVSVTHLELNKPQKIENDGDDDEENCDQTSPKKF